MKTYNVRMLFTTHVDIKVQASTEDAARIKANDILLNMHDIELYKQLLENRNFDGTDIEEIENE